MADVCRIDRYSLFPNTRSQGTAFPQGQHDRLELTLISCGQQLNEHHFGAADRQIANYMEHSDLAFCHTHQSLCEIIRARLSGLEEADVPGGFLFRDHDY